ADRSRRCLRRRGWAASSDDHAARTARGRCGGLDAPRRCGRARGSDRRAGASEGELMSGVMVVAETRGGRLGDPTLALVDAALEIKPVIGGPLLVLVVDNQPEVHVPALSIEGVDCLLLVESPLAQFEAHVSDSALGAVIEAESPSLVLLCHSVDSMGFA